MDGTLFLIKLYIYIIICIHTNCVWWNRGGGTENIVGKPMALFVNFIPNMVSQIEGRHFAWKPKIVSKLEYPYGDLLFECFSSDSWSKFSSWIAQRGISSLLINHNAEALSFIESVIYNDNFGGAIKYLYCNLWISHSSNAESVICSKTD